MEIYDSMYFNVSYQVFNIAVIFEKILGDIELKAIEVFHAGKWRRRGAEKIILVMLDAMEVFHAGKWRRRGAAF